MAPSKIRKAIGALKDRTSIYLARIGGTPVANLEVAILKATRHEERPPNQLYVNEIITLTSYSRILVNACVCIIAARLNKTKNWVVALKSLMLVQRLLSQGGLAFEKEIFFATRKGTRFLNMSDFQDAYSKTKAWHYSQFLRTYALYLDELLEFRMQGNRGKRRSYMIQNGEEDKQATSTGALLLNNSSPVSEMNDDTIFSKLHHLMLLLDRFIECRPTGAAKHNVVVVMALIPIVQESFQLYQGITELMAALIERFMQFQVPDMVRVHEVFCRASKQFDELDSFYGWSKTVGIVHFSKYPDVKRIPQAKLDMMEDFIFEKAAMLQNKMRAVSPNRKPTPFQQTLALPQPEESLELIKITDEKTVKATKEEGDLLNLYEDAPPVTNDLGDKMALALFCGDVETSAPASTTTPWEAFKDSSGDWETALVESVSHLSNQKPSLPNGFDIYSLDCMYQQGAMASSGFTGTNMLALPAPPVANGTANGFSSNDPFAASLAIEAPTYVQMSEFENKQRLLVQEQLMWQQFARGGMQGHVGLANVQQHNSYQYIPAGGYVQTW